MKIEMELKPGDIVLLKLLACILIAFFSFRFLIFPGIEKNQEMEITRQSLEDEQEEMQFTINNAPTVETMIEKQKDTLKEKSTAYQPLMENREVDELVTGIVLEHNLFPVYLSIAETVPGVPAAYFLSDLAIPEDPELAAAETDTDMDTEDGESDEASDSTMPDVSETSYIQYMNTTEVSVTIRGTETEIHAFMDDLAKNYQGIQIRSFQIQDSSYVNSDWEMVDTISCNCVLAVYTCGGIDEMEETRSE